MASRWLTFQEGLDAAERCMGPSAHHQLLLYLRRGEITAQAERMKTVPLIKTYRNNLTYTNSTVSLRLGTPKWESVTLIPASFWLDAAADIPSGVAVRKDEQGRVIAQATGIVLSRDDVDRLWPAGKEIVPVTEADANAGGRPRSWDWEGALIEMARIAVFEEVVPATHDEWVDRIRRWFEANHQPVKGRKHPGDTLLNERVRRFRQTLWPRVNN
jgi:hypothetical protein